MLPRLSWNTPFFIVAVLLASRLSAEPNVRLEVFTDAGTPPAYAYKWLEQLKAVDFDGVRIRSGRGGDKVQMVNLGGDAAPSYQVTGRLTSDNLLYLPGGRFSLSDRGRIAAWLEQVRQGESGDGDGKQAFGLTSEELVDVHEGLATGVSFKTKEVAPKEAIRGISRSISLRIEIDPTVMDSFSGDEKVFDELEGVSGGTALAAILRPLGLVFAPRKNSAGKIQLYVTDFRKVEESWPVGWPPEEKVRDIAPKLFEFLPVTINNVALTDAMTAIGARMEMPMLYDHNALARHGIDPTKMPVSIPSGRTYYKKVIDRVLFQGKLKAEVRIDESGSPLLWISTIKR
jgi:hypothetical protein